MMNSLISLLTPQANVTVATSNRRSRTANSTAIDMDRSNSGSSEMSGNISSITPGKLTRENSMNSDSYSSDGGEQNLSIFFKHNIDAVDLSEPDTQKYALQYLLTKVRDMETLLIKSVKDNETLKDEVSTLYVQNDALAAENISLKDMISAQKDTISAHDDAKKILAEEMDDLKDTFYSAKSYFSDIVKANNEFISGEFDSISDFGGKLYHRVEALEASLKEAQQLSARNQILLEIQRGELKTQHGVLLRLEKELSVTNQYNRRENLIIDGIPADIPQEQLEELCLEIVHGIGFHQVGSYEVVACHRLKKKVSDPTPPVIIRFVNRKITDFCMRQRWRLKNLRWGWDLSFREDLCDANLSILNECEKLKKDGKLHKVYTYNGFVRVSKTASSRTFKLMHISEIDAIF